MKTYIASVEGLPHLAQLRPCRGFLNAAVKAAKRGREGGQ